MTKSRRYSLILATLLVLTLSMYPSVSAISYSDNTYGNIIPQTEKSNINNSYTTINNTYINMTGNLSIGSTIYNSLFNHTVLFIDGNGKLAQSNFFKYFNGQLNLTTVGGNFPLLIDDKKVCLENGTNCQSVYIFPNITVGNSTGNITISNSGNLVLNGDATQWDDMTIPLTSAKVGILNPPTLLVFRGTTYAYGFKNAGAGNEEDMIGTLQMSHSYKLNSLIRCHIHWACGTTSANNVTWGLEYTKASIGEVFPLPTTLRATGSCGTAYTHNLADFGQDGNFTGISGVMNLRVFRNSANATDNYNADDVYGLSLDCHYQKDSLGSNEEFIK